jgi:hypothetical protein
MWISHHWDEILKHDNESRWYQDEFWKDKSDRRIRKIHTFERDSNVFEIRQLL